MSLSLSIQTFVRCTIYRLDFSREIRLQALSEMTAKTWDMVQLVGRHGFHFMPIATSPLLTRCVSKFPLCRDVRNLYAAARNHAIESCTSAAHATEQHIEIARKSIPSIIGPPLILTYCFIIDILHWAKCWRRI